MHYIPYAMFMGLVRLFSSLVAVLCLSSVVGWAVSHERPESPLPEVKTLGEMAPDLPEMGMNLYDESITTLREGHSFVEYRGGDRDENLHFR